MKKFFAISIVLLVALPVLLLSACGGGGGGGGGGGETSSAGSGDSSAAVTTLNGVVADGYLRNARVFLDRNRDRVYNNGEPTVMSTHGGAYALTVNPGEGELYPVVVEVIAGQTIDEDDDLEVADGYYMEALAGHWGFVSPLTTMVALEGEKNPSLSPLRVEIMVREKLGVPDTVSFYTDYIAAAAANADGLGDGYLRTHKIAKIVAGLMGRVQPVVAGIPGLVNQSAAAFIVSDQVLLQRDEIAAALNSGATVSTVINNIAAGMDMSGVDGTLLTRYLERIAANHDIWDMEPPQPQRQFPAAADTASIDTLISVTFDEALDENLLVDGIIEVYGPNGLVAGNISYDADNFTLTFAPNQVLFAFNDYRVVVSETLTDSLGNPLGADLEWPFETNFGLLPPALPDFM